MQTQQFQDALTEATRLTRTGRLADATALIQRTLGNPGDGGAPGPTGERVSDRPGDGASGRPGGAVDSRAPIPPASVTLPHRGTRTPPGRVKRARGSGEARPRGRVEARARVGWGRPTDGMPCVGASALGGLWGSGQAVVPLPDRHAATTTSRMRSAPQCLGRKAKAPAARTASADSSVS